ncbi:MAG: hypothetical protein CO030_02360 [Candidatus Magasanikbacteria bacterium CG_4_9_14_0_2_um_filter_42_11]|uniref:Uncharacterized protein n=1 Tax=Candidatus Magasanikbacteria bacterium CG_4_9_14_0_2_um_filter_42_11 TaxID=1974643 RepID=A0A2M8F9W2_9BACT|nr:MAG: hypothetical protein COU34_02530 [Candidatus Magasanikbacteria bacterium CG10_big_fil_rev_8_21_14_0_10_43_9]PIY92742.1 MAG: hypothetical protein COY70_01650 [Candidatus Magasanikbacteria bacterium CG_4_10_14_0_8_um_filter_42_12]PJC52534.1 MAG: hypothetical protein CO030_02360 [Candidatus Magasanikbacteria bacterium CG_4_9_14_0_2_um_filter_42_11]
MEEQILKKLEEQSGTLDSLVKKVDDQADILQSHEKQIDNIARFAMENKTDIEWIKENMSTKEDHREVMNTLDTIVKMMTKRDQEMTFMGERVKRVENDVKKLKVVSGVA